MDALIRPPTDGAAALANELSGLGQEEEEEYDDDDDGEGAGTVNVHDYMYDWSCMPTSIPSTYLPTLCTLGASRWDYCSTRPTGTAAAMQYHTVHYLPYL